ncbi:type III pantothenate kinase [Candidatus Poribacteria bacterium]|nr:type III pantothenate kinase [Candidatus Poribacteria bacterium]
MFLAVDIGNTHTTLAMMREHAVVREWRLTTRQSRTADELSATLRGLAGIACEGWQGAAICSVVPLVNSTFVQAVGELTGIEPLLLHGEMDLGLRNEYEDPREVGMDRLVNAVAGRSKYGAPLVIVDFGTATTLDVVTREGNYAGGVILPGLETTADALSQRTAKLPHITVERPATALGKTTIHSMRSGLYFGSIDAVEGCIRRLEHEVGYKLRAIATGGLSPVLGPDMSRLHAIDANLTLEGIEMVWQRNQPRGGA